MDTRQTDTKVDTVMHKQTQYTDKQKNRQTDRQTDLDKDRLRQTQAFTATQSSKKPWLWYLLHHLANATSNNCKIGLLISIP